MFSLHNTEAVPPGGKFFPVAFRHLQRIVGGTIVHQDHLNLPPALYQHGIQHFRQAVRAVVYRRHNGHHTRSKGSFLLHLFHPDPACPHRLVQKGHVIKIVHVPSFQQLGPIAQYHAQFRLVLKPLDVKRR